MVDFKKMRVENFMPFQAADVEFTHGLTFIEGDNRDREKSNKAGKSSVFEALVWCLYDKTIRNMPIGDVVNNRAKGSPCKVVLYFADGEKYYTLARLRHPGKHGSKKVSIECDGTDITPADNKEAQALIDRVVGIDYEGFMNVCVFAHNNRFRFIQLTNSEQKKIIEGIIGLGDRFDKYLARTKQAISAVVQKAVDEKEQKLIMTERVRSLEAEKQRVEMSIDRALAKNEEIAAVKETLESLEKKRIELVATYDKIQKKKDSAAKTSAAAKEREDCFRIELSAFMQETRDFDSLLEDGKCYTCEQEIDEGLVKKLKSVQDAKQEKLEKGEKQAEEECSKACAVEIEYRKKLSTVAAAVTALDEKLALKKHRNVDVAEHQKNLERIEGELKEAKESQLYAKLSVDKLEKRIKHLEFLEEAFSRDGIESMLFDQLLPFLNERANYYASELSDGCISVNFATLKKTRSTGEFRDAFHVQVGETEGGESYGACSSSEERWADLAVALAKRDLAEASGRKLPPILLLDEVGDALDSVGAGRLLNFLLKYAIDKTVWLISHDPVLAEHSQQRIVVTREGGVSRVG